MCENLEKEITVEVAKAVAVEGYRDTLQPALKAVGSVIALPFQAIDAALSKPKLWVAEKHYNYERTCQLLAEKLKNTPEELIVPPENYVAVPALQQIAYCFDSDELRDMYANLLANSMNKVVKNGVHPGFVDIIKQLSPDEAKILKHMKTHPVEPTITLRYRYDSGGGVDIIRDFSDIGERVGCEQAQNISAYLDNLVRLGLILNVGNLSSLSNKSCYEPLKKHRWVAVHATDKCAQARGYDKYSFEEGFVRLSAYGIQFCSVCLDAPKPIVITVEKKSDNNDQL